MLAIKETTDWKTYNTPNHIYFTDDSKSKMFAYIKSGTNEIFEFKNPLPLRVKGRQFKTITNTWGFFPKEELKPVSKSWKVKGTTGEYTVTEENGTLTCSCAGFRFRQTCRHIIQQS